MFWRQCNLSGCFFQNNPSGKGFESLGNDCVEIGSGGVKNVSVILPNGGKAHASMPAKKFSDSAGDFFRKRPFRIGDAYFPGPAFRGIANAFLCRLRLSEELARLIQKQDAQGSQTYFPAFPME